MTKEKINQLISEGYKVRVYLTPNKQYTNMLLKTVLFNEKSNSVYEVYHNHLKEHLTIEQMAFIDTYQTVKNWQFKNDVEANIKFKAGTETKEDIQKRVVRQSIKNLTYLEQ